MGFKLPITFPEFVKNPKEAITYLAILGLCVLFTFLYRNQQAEKQLLKDNWAKCENGNYQRDVKISILEIGKARSDSLLNRIIGKLEAIEEIKKQNKNNETVSSSNVGGVGNVVQ